MVKPSTPRPASDMNIIAVIDASKGAGVNRVGIITAAMRRQLRQ